MKRISLPNRDALMRVFSYDAQSGILERKYNPEVPSRTNKQFAGRRAGTPARGFVRTLAYGQLYYAHLIIWKMFHGQEPGRLRHINGDRSDNRISNLEEIQ